MVLKASYAYAKAILTESKHGYGLLFLGLGAESMALRITFRRPSKRLSANSPAPSQSLSIAEFAMLPLTLPWKRF